MACALRGMCNKSRVCASVQCVCANGIVCVRAMCVCVRKGARVCGVVSGAMKPA